MSRVTLDILDITLTLKLEIKNYKIKRDFSHYALSKWPKKCYNIFMDAIHQFIKKRPFLVWYVKDLDRLDEASIVEHVLNYGDWDDVQEMIGILGMQKTAAIFREKSKGDKFGRQNYRPISRHYFTLYFNKHAQIS